MTQSPIWQVRKATSLALAHRRLAAAVRAALGAKATEAAAIALDELSQVWERAGLPPSFSASGFRVPPVWE